MHELNRGGGGGKCRGGHEKKIGESQRKKGTDNQTGGKVS